MNSFKSFAILAVTMFILIPVGESLRADDQFDYLDRAHHELNSSNWAAESALETETVEKAGLETEQDASAESKSGETLGTTIELESMLKSAHDLLGKLNTTFSVSQMITLVGSIFGVSILYLVLSK
jgi:hypothetical protein